MYIAHSLNEQSMCQNRKNVMQKEHKYVNHGYLKTVFIMVDNIFTTIVKILYVRGKAVRI